MELVPKLFGGVVPTDIQGMYRNGVPTVSTAADSPWYHTTQDTPDKVDSSMLAPIVDEFDVALESLMMQPASAFAQLDMSIWQASITPQARTAGAPLTVDVTITDAQSRPQSNALVDASVMVDDFMPQVTLHGTSDASGHVSFSLPAAAVDAGAGNRFLHVTAGPSYPYVEQILALP
jgi:hypothetical protein